MAEQMPLEFNPEPEGGSAPPAEAAPKKQEPPFDWGNIHEEDNCPNCGNPREMGSCPACARYKKEGAPQQSSKPAPKKEKPKAGFAYHKSRPGFLVDRKKNVYDTAYNLVELAPDAATQKMIVRLAKTRADWLERDLSDLARIHLKFDAQKRQAKAAAKAAAKKPARAKKKPLKNKKKAGKRR